MLNSLLLGAALVLGQTDAPAAPRAQLLPPVGGHVVIVPSSTEPAAVEVAPASFASGGVMQSVSGMFSSLCGHGCGSGCGNSCGSSCCGNSCGSSCGGCCNDCNVVWLKPWKCEDLQMKPAEHKCHCDSCGFLHSLLWCPPKEEEKKDENGNGKDEKKNGNGKEEKKNGKEAKEEKKNGDTEEEKKDEEPDLNPLMQEIKCRFPALFDRLQCNGAKIYGWVQGGYTFNTDSPRDRLNYGVNFNNRSNDFLLNQAYIVLEKTLDLDKKKCEWQIGYRVDFWGGHDAPYIENPGLGWFDRFTGDRQEASRLSEFGIGIPQFYLDIHAPILTDRGVDFRFGRQYTLMTYELTPAPSTLFYSHSYEYFYAMPFTQFGAYATVHLGDTVDVTNGIVRGWDVVWQDNNDSMSWHGAVAWNSCDKAQNFTFAWFTGPEQNGNNHNDRTVLTAYYSRKFGCYNEWQYVGGGGIGWEQNASLDPTPLTRSAEWYSVSSYLFYTVNPKLILGVRGEWFHDDDGSRTVFANSDNGGDAFNRPGYAGSFYDLTFGVTYKPYQNLRVRPEVRFDWFDGKAIDGSASLPFGDQHRRFQTTLGIDFVYEF